MSIGLIPRKRLRWIPEPLRLAHEYCFFLHDECARLLIEYEKGEASIVAVEFPNKEAGKRFQRLAKAHGPIEAMQRAGYGEEARKVILNQITMALTSDLLHHVYEALWCMEKRKVIVAFNTFRKPLMDNLSYCAWMLGDPDDFYAAFIKGDPEEITQRKLGNKRQDLFRQAAAKTELADLINTDDIHEVLHSRKRDDGLQRLFQHAVHLVTIKHVELKTTPQNFNFVFKSNEDDDIYELAYRHLPSILLFAAHILDGVFRQMHPGEPAAHQAFSTRSILGYRLVQDIEAADIVALLKNEIGNHLKCPACKRPTDVTPYNALRIALTESFRCTSCKRTVVASNLGRGRIVQFDITNIMRG